MKTSNQVYARVAGFAFLFYIVATITGMALGDESQVTDLLLLFQSISAIVLGVTLYALTNKQGQMLALFAMMCRVAEGILNNDGAIFFSVGSLIFCWLLLRGGLIPTILAQFGLIASVLLVIALPLQLGGVISGTSSAFFLVWLPMLVFEIVFAFWLMIKGVNVDHSEKHVLQAV